MEDTERGREQEPEPTRPAEEPTPPTDVAPPEEPTPPPPEEPGPSPVPTPPDQATSATFRAMLLVELLAAGLFGLVPFAVPDAFASFFGYPGAEPFLYRLAGAATTGYAVMALAAFFRPRWATFRIPLAATFVFTVAAVAGALLSLDAGDTSALALVVIVAASIFAFASAYWLYRDEGPRPADGEPIEDGFRATLIAATAAAAFFGILPLFLTRTFVDLWALPDSDLVIYRLAGAATLGYAVGGVFQVVSGRWAEIRLLVLGAIAFNVLSVLAAAIYVATGGASILGPIVLLAGGFFTLALTWWSARAAR